MLKRNDKVLENTRKWQPTISASTLNMYEYRFTVWWYNLMLSIINIYMLVYFTAYFKKTKNCKTFILVNSLILHDKCSSKLWHLTPVIKKQPRLYSQSFTRYILCFNFRKCISIRPNQKAPIITSNAEVNHVIADLRLWTISTAAVTCSPLPNGFIDSGGPVAKLRR